MRRFICGGLMLISLNAGCALGQLNTASKTDEVLDALHADGKNIKSFSADLHVTEYDSVFDTTKDQFGKVWFQIKADGNPVLHVALDHKEVRGRRMDEKIDYLLDDGWLVNRTAEIKNESRIQTARPGQKVDLFQLGKGPFPLPIGQDKTEVHKQFDVTRLDPVNDDPAGTIHLLLKPKAGSPLEKKFFSVDVWTDLRTQMPVRIKTFDEKQAVERTVNFIDLKTNSTIDQKDLTLPPLPPDWKTSDTPLPQ